MQTSNPLQFEWHGVAEPTSGYGKHSYNVLKILTERGHKIKFIPFGYGIKKLPPFFEKLSKTNLSSKNKIIRINCIPPHPIYARNRYNILYTMIESVTLHSGVVSRLRTVDEIWTPSKCNAVLFRKYKLPKDKIFIMPEGVDTSIYNPSGSPLDLHQFFTDSQLFLIHNSTSNFKQKNPPLKGDTGGCNNPKPFIILSVFSWQWRKGWDVLLRSYYRAFSPSDNVLLVLFTYIPNARGYYTNISITRDILTIKAQEQISYNLPVLILTDPFPEEQMASLYKASNLFFLPTRGEGWCLPALEAMACATPVAITRGSGQSMFCTPKNSFLINSPTYSRYPGDNYQILQFFDHQFFQEPDPDHAAHILRKAYTNPKLCAKKSKIALKDVQTKFTWSRAADQIESRIKQISDSIL